MQETIDSYQRILKFVRRNKIKSLHVSYEKMLHNKYVYGEELADFCNISASKSLLSNVASVIEASPPRYLQWASNSRIKLSGYEGHIDQISKSLVSGWIVNNKNPLPVTIGVLINGKFIGEFVSDIFRDDLIKAKKSASGKAGFCITLPAEGLKEKDVVTIKPIGCEDGLSSLPF